MGRKKKLQEPEKQPEKVPEVKPTKVVYRCNIEGQWRDFDTQEKAREMAMSLLNTGNVFFMQLTKETINI